MRILKLCQKSGVSMKVDDSFRNLLHRSKNNLEIRYKSTSPHAFVPTYDGAYANTDLQKAGLAPNKIPSISHPVLSLSPPRGLTGGALTPSPEIRLSPQSQSTSPSPTIPLTGQTVDLLPTLLPNLCYDKSYNYSTCMYYNYNTCM